VACSVISHLSLPSLSLNSCGTLWHSWFGQSWVSTDVESMLGSVDCCVCSREDWFGGFWVTFILGCWDSFLLITTYFFHSQTPFCFGFKSSPRS
jgi:hypothetical protein